MIVLYSADFQEPLPVVLLLFTANMGAAFSGVVIEAILVN